MMTPSNNRRRVDRTSLDYTLYAIIGTTPQTLGQVVEISSTGLAFTFVDIGDVSHRLTDQSTIDLDLFQGGYGFIAKGLKCRLVSAIANDTALPLTSYTIKRVGVAFESLTFPQQVRINRLARQQGSS